MKYICIHGHTYTIKCTSMPCQFSIEIIIITVQGCLRKPGGGFDANCYNMGESTKLIISGGNSS